MRRRGDQATSSGVQHGHGECVAGLLLLELGERLGLQLPGGGAKLLIREEAPVEPPKESMPSEFSSISWMRGGIDPGISIFKVITLSAPAGVKTGDLLIRNIT